MLEAKKITKTIDGLQILNGASLSVEPGRVTVLIGPSGSGKTSVLRILAGLDSPASGQVLVDGQDLAALEPRKLWPKVTMVFQQLFLWPHLTLRQNLTLALREDDDRGLRETGVASLCYRLGLASLVDRYPNELSLGEKQRGALARALLLEPRYLLLDEVTSALDVESAQLIVGLLNDLKASSKVGFLLVTHHLGLARKVGDEVVFMDAGRVVESGAVGVLEEPSTKRLKRFLSVA